MSGRENILARIRAHAAAGEDEPSRAARVEARLGAHARGTVPARGQQDKAGRIALLRQILEGQSASVRELDALEAVPAEIADYLRRHNLAPRLGMGADAALAGLDWGGANLELRHGRANAELESACSMAFAAVAESGTLVLTSGPDNPTSLNFMPDNHIIVVRADQVMGSYEDGWDALRAAFADGPPRTVNYVSGPSRTGDIEQTILLGAHGPRRLHVIIVK